MRRKATLRGKPYRSFYSIPFEREILEAMSRLRYVEEIEEGKKEKERSLESLL